MKKRRLGELLDGTIFFEKNKTKEIRAMAYNDTFLKQLLSLVPTYEFDSLAQM